MLEGCNKIKKNIILFAVVFITSGCCLLVLGKSAQIPNHKDHDNRGYYTVSLNPRETKTLDFKVLEVDDFILWEVDKASMNIKLIGPSGKSYSYKCACDSVEGLDYVYLFEIQDPPPGKWQMILKSKTWFKEVSSGIKVDAYSNTIDAYKNFKNN